MNRRLLLTAVGLLLVAGLIGVAVWKQDVLRQWFQRGSETTADAQEAEHAAHGDRLALSEQARKSLDARPVKLTEVYWRKLEIPGVVVERPGQSHRGITAPVEGIVEKVLVLPSQIVKPGQKLFRLHLLSKHLLESQAKLYQTMLDLDINQQERDRLAKAGGGIPQVKRLELEYKEKKLQADAKSHRFDLSAHGFSDEQIRNAEKGKFATEIDIVVPPLEKMESSASISLHFEVEELKIQAGQQVAAGQLLAVLANYRLLYIEGRVYKQEIPFIEQAREKNWPVKAEVPSEKGNQWTTLEHPLHIEFFGNQMDEESQTIPVYLPLPNSFHEHDREGRSYRIWRHRPAQRVYLEIPVEPFRNIYLLPVDAVARDGVEDYVFRQNGNAFERVPVQVLYRDRRNVVISKDSLSEDDYIAHNGAARLLRALKLQASGGGGGHHHHHH